MPKSFEVMSTLHNHRAGTHGGLRGRSVYEGWCLKWKIRSGKLCRLFRLGAPVSGCGPYSIVKRIALHLQTLRLMERLADSGIFVTASVTVFVCV